LPCLDINGKGDTVIHIPRTGKNRGIPQEIPEKHVKYPASWRIIPIHPILWNDLGFGGFVEQCKKSGQKKLFPELGIHRDGPGTAFSKWFDEEIAPYVAGDVEPKKTLYSFRHSYQTWFKHRQLIGLERRFANEILKEVVGHSYNKGGEEDLAKERYGKKYPPSLMANLVFQLDYNLNFHNITEQVGHFIKLHSETEKLKHRNSNLDYPQEDTREQ
jgi:hypothetical protein